MLGGYQPRRVVREGEREIPSEVDSKADQRILMEMVPRGGPHRRLIPRRLENPEEADYTNQRMHFFCSGRACLFAFEESNTRLDLSHLRPTETR
jgi:hypothetical protein